MKCLVLGGNGFLGSHLCNALHDKGHEVSIFGHRNPVFGMNFLHTHKFEYFEGDFRDSANIEKCIDGCDVIFHLISTTIPGSSNANPVFDAETNILGTLKVIELVKKYSLKKMIFISSGGTIYGTTKQIPISESHPTNPSCAYGISKLAIEKYLHLYEILEGLEYCILRLSNPFGEHQNPISLQGAVSVFLYQALCGNKIDVWGDGSVTRDYFYVSDAITAMIAAMNYDGNERIFNIGSGTGLSLNEIIKSIENLLGKSLDIKYLKSRSYDLPINILDISKASRELNWKPTVQFPDGLARTARWFEQIFLSDNNTKDLH